MDPVSDLDNDDVDGKTGEKPMRMRVHTADLQNPGLIDTIAICSGEIFDARERAKNRLSTVSKTPGYQ